MSAIYPRFVLCVLGHWQDLDEVDAIVKQSGCEGFQVDREFSQCTPDERMMNSFEASYDRVSPSMTGEDWKAVETHQAVIYVLSPPVRNPHDISVASSALKLTAALLSNGGVAAKCESAGIAHGREHWLQLGDELANAVAHGESFKQGSALYWAWVRKPLVDNTDSVYYSCGMHLLGERDIEIESSLDLTKSLEWIDLLGLYMTADRPGRPLLEGEGFRLTDEGPGRVMSLQTCKRYEEDDFFFNPYGYIRLVQPRE